MPWKSDRVGKLYSRNGKDGAERRTQSGGVLTEKSVPSCWTYAGGGGFIVAGQLRPVNVPQSGRNGANLGLTRKQVECTVQTENLSETPQNANKRKPPRKGGYCSGFPVRSLIQPSPTAIDLSASTAACHVGYTSKCNGVCSGLCTIKRVLSR